MFRKKWATLLFFSLCLPCRKTHLGTDKVKSRRMMRTYHLKIEKDCCLGCIVYYLDQWVGIMIDCWNLYWLSSIVWWHGIEVFSEMSEQDGRDSLLLRRTCPPWMLHLQRLLWHHAFLNPWISLKLGEKWKQHSRYENLRSLFGCWGPFAKFFFSVEWAFGIPDASPSRKNSKLTEGSRTYLTSHQLLGIQRCLPQKICAMPAWWNIQASIFANPSTFACQAHLLAFGSELSQGPPELSSLQILLMLHFPNFW